MLTGMKTSQKGAYLDFVNQDAPEEIRKFYPLKNLPAILGSDSFKELIKENFAHPLFRMKCLS